MVIAVVLAILGSYVVGSIPFGYLAGRLKGVDVRTRGSGNIGATNVFRVIGKTAGIAVFSLDFCKGYIPVAVGGSLAGNGILPDWVPVVMALAAILGHNYTFWLGFKGGKGIATSAGAIVALVPLAVGLAAGVWIVLMVATRYVAVASLGAALTIPLVVAGTGIRNDAVDAPLLGFSVLVAILAFVRHRANITRLMSGSEHRFGTSGGDMAGGEHIVRGGESGEGRESG